MRGRRAAGSRPCCPSGRGASRRGAARPVPRGWRRARGRLGPARTMTIPPARRPRLADRRNGARPRPTRSRCNCLREPSARPVRARVRDRAPVRVERCKDAAIAAHARNQKLAIRPETECVQETAGGDFRVDLAGVSVLDLHHLAVAQHTIEFRRRAPSRTVEVVAADKGLRQRAGGIGGVACEVHRRGIGRHPDSRLAQRVGARLLRRGGVQRPENFRARRRERDGRLLASRREQPHCQRDGRAR